MIYFLEVGHICLAFQSDNESGADSFLAFDSHGASHLLNEVLTDRETQSHAVWILLFVFSDLTEVDEQRIQLVFRNSHAFVNHLDVKTDERLSVFNKISWFDCGNRGRIFGIGNSKGITEFFLWVSDFTRKWLLWTLLLGPSSIIMASLLRKWGVPLAQLRILSFKILDFICLEKDSDSASLWAELDWVWDEVDQDLNHSPLVK